MDKKSNAEAAMYNIIVKYIINRCKLHVNIVNYDVQVELPRSRIPVFTPYVSCRGKKTYE